MAASHDLLRDTPTPDAPALITTQNTYTYAQLDALVAATANCLPRDTDLSESNPAAPALAAVTDTSLASVLFLLACWRTGIVACPLSPRFPEALRAACLQQAGVKTLFSLDSIELAPPVPAPLPTLSPGHPAAIVFTSGSSGTPKAALLSYANLLTCAERSNANIPLAPGDTWLLSLPLYHVSGLGVVFRCLAAGAAIALPDPAASLEESIERFRPTHLSLVATQLHRLLETAHAGNQWEGERTRAGNQREGERTRELLPAFRQCKAILLGGGPMPATLLQRAHSLHLPIHTSYGLTEMASQVCTTVPDDSLEHLQTSGIPLDPASIHIDPSGNIRVGGPTRFLGYLENGTLRIPFDADGYFHTGDRGALDASGYLIVLGRSDNMFIAGGENVHPEEIEARLQEVPGVARAVVAGAPHPEFGAVPVAFVKMAPGHILDPPGMQRAVAEWLPRFKVPRLILPWPAEVDSEAMKVNRRLFREWANEMAVP